MELTWPADGAGTMGPTDNYGPLIGYLQKTAEEKSAPGYCKYLGIRLDGHGTRAMVDSGNTWRSAISMALCKDLGVSRDQLIPLASAKVGTASKGVNLRVAGELPSGVNLTIDSVPGRTFPFRPVVIDNLAMEANLSGPWLKRHGWDQIHTEDALRIDG